MAVLTEREEDVLRKIRQGWSVKRIANLYGVTEAIAERYVRHAEDKLIEGADDVAINEHYHKRSSRELDR